MDELLSDNEREEALRQWWRDNWAWIVGGVVLGVGLLVGWNYWGSHRQRQAESAGQLYSDIEAAVAAGDAAKAQEKLTVLIGDFDSSEYAQQGRLLVAKTHVEAAKFAEAEALLRTVADQSKDEELAAVAKLRLARLLIQEGKHDDALKLLEPLTTGGFSAQAREIRGDALFAKGDSEGARAEYAAALAETGAQIDRQIVELKLQDVGGVVPASGAVQGTL
jgi:predicted negative regulator of RcsB-dependent stress response